MPRRGAGRARRPRGRWRRVEIARCRGGEARIATHVGEPLKLGVDDAAAAIVRVAEARMAGAIRLVSIERGHDLRGLSRCRSAAAAPLMPGADREIGLKAALVPRFRGITSALGCVLADLRTTRCQTLNVMLEGVDSAALERRMQAAGPMSAAVIADATFRSSGPTSSTSSDMHYLGQTHTVAVPLPVQSNGPLGCDRDDDSEGFEAEYLASSAAAAGPANPDRFAPRRRIGRRQRLIFACLRPSPSGVIGQGQARFARVWLQRVSRHHDLVAARPARRARNRGTGHTSNSPTRQP
jgi:N-methylhydantoinase A